MNSHKLLLIYYRTLKCGDEFEIREFGDTSDVQSVQSIMWVVLWCGLEVRYLNRGVASCGRKTDWENKWQGYDCDSVHHKELEWFIFETFAVELVDWWEARILMMLHHETATNEFKQYLYGILYDLKRWYNKSLSICLNQWIEMGRIRRVAKEKGKRFLNNQQKNILSLDELQKRGSEDVWIVFRLDEHVK